VEVDEYGALPERVPLTDDAGEFGGALERRRGGSRFLLLLNFGEEQQSVALGEEWSDAFTGEVLTAAEVAPIDMRLLRREM